MEQISLRDGAGSVFTGVSVQLYRSQFGRGLNKRRNITDGTDIPQRRSGLRLYRG